MNLSLFRRKSPDPQFNIKGFKALVDKIRKGTKEVKIEEIENLIQFNGLITHYTHKDTKKLILASCPDFEYKHEHHTSMKLTGEDYHVLFTPKGFFKWNEKKHDVFLLKKHLLLEADLKCIYSTNPDTIGKRIKEGSEQAKRIVLDIHADLDKLTLIDGLRLGCQRNDFIKQILLFFKSQFHQLDKNLILSKNIYQTI